MPGYKGHLIGGLGAFGVGFYFVSAGNPSHYVVVEWLLCALAGSLFPDVDVKSKGQNLFYKGILIILLLLCLQGYVYFAAAIGILSLFPMLARHRGLFHKAWFIVIMPFFTSFCISVYFPHFSRILLFDTVFFVLGALSHLWLDLGFLRMVRL